MTATATRGESALLGVALAVLGEDGRTGGHEQMAQDLSRYVQRLPKAARVGALCAATGLEAASLASTGRRLAALDPGRTSALLERLGSNGTLAQAVEPLKTLALMVAAAEVAGASGPAAPSAGSGETARPDADLDVTAAPDWPSVSDADAVVIGSGAGGAMAARTLARAGLDVVVVEEGRRFGVDEFQARAPADRFAALYRDAGATVALGRPPVLVPLGRGVGGTTLVNSGTCFKPPAEVTERWEREAGFTIAGPAALEPYLDEVWDTLEVGPSPPSVLGANARLTLAGASELGWHAEPLKRNAPGCAGSCQCAVGCPRNAKYGVHLNALPQACTAGARILSQAHVERVITVGSRAEGVLARRADGSTMTIRAPRVFVAAGATGTPPLLRRSDLAGHPQMGRNLALHPALTVAGRFDEPVVPWRGVLQSVGIEDFHGEGILLEATAGPPGLGSLSLPGYGAELRDELRASSHLATVGAMIADAASGRVAGARRPLMTYSLARRDGARLLRAIELAGRVLLAAGATELLTGLSGDERVHSVRELRAAVERADPRQLHLAAFHPTGTARAGSDPVRHPVEADGKLRGTHNVWVCDASILPSCPEVNPQVTIMALALAVADGATGRSRT